MRVPSVRHHLETLQIPFPIATVVRAMRATIVLQARQHEIKAASALQATTAPLEPRRSSPAARATIARRVHHWSIRAVAVLLDTTALQQLLRSCARRVHIAHHKLTQALPARLDRFVLLKTYSVPRLARRDSFATRQA